MAIELSESKSVAVPDLGSRSEMASSSSKLSWYLARVSAMSPGEICSRLDHKVKENFWRRRKTWDAPRPGVIAPACLDWQSVLEQFDGEDRNTLIAQADQFLSGQYEFLGHSIVEPEMQWHLDVEAGIEAPRGFAMDINYRDTATVGHIKNIWEKSRHQHLTVLALAYATTKDERYAQACASQLRSWNDENPTLRGVNWANGLELGIRLISWVWIDRLLYDSQHHAGLFGPQGCMWPAIYWHQWLIAKWHSPGSSANNHLIGEMVGLFVASLAWPCFDKSTHWRDLSGQILEREIVRQTYPSGLNRELAFDYHLFSLELFAVTAVEADRYHYVLSNEFHRNMSAMYQVIDCLTDIGGNLPRFGDGDDATALRLCADQSSRLAWILDLGRHWALPDSDSVVEARPIQSALMMPKLTCGTTFTRLNESTALADAGVYVLTSGRRTPKELFCVADAGPLGYLAIAAHGHTDALSFAFSVGGHPVIVDPGTFAYHGHLRWRSYFRGTRAHNTICIDGRDQADGVLPFIWRGRVNTQVLQWKTMPTGARLSAEHDGYQRIDGRPVHRRDFELNQQRLMIADYLRGDGAHRIEFRLHFAPDCEARIERESCNLSWATGSMQIHLDSQLDWRLSRADHDGGWYSPHFGTRVPTTTLIGQVETRLPIELNTTMEVHHED